MKINGSEEVTKALEKLDFDLVSLIAETSIWADPEYCINLKRNTGSVTMNPKCRRGRTEEKRGDKIDGITIDDNTYANNAIKRAVGIKREDISDYEACHIWANTCYDERYHTAIPNLVLIPRAIASLSDHMEAVIDALKYRSYELYKWKPEEVEEAPLKPAKYPSNWREPQQYIKNIINKKSLQEYEMESLIEIDQIRYCDKIKNEIEKVERRVPKWLANSTQINSIILNEFMLLACTNKTLCVSKADLETRCILKGVKDFNGNFNQMLHFGDNNHGKVFDMQGEYIKLWEPVQVFIITEWNKINPSCTILI